jgi:YVTN family beta-propeller protein
VVRADGGAPNLAYVAGAGSHADELAVVDVAARQVTAHIAVAGNPGAVVLSFDSHFAYVVQQTAGSLAFVDASARSVTATVPVGPQPHGLVQGYSSGSIALFVAVTGANQVVVVRPDTRRVIARIAVGGQPTGEAVAAQGSGIQTADINDEELYVANTDGNTVSVISTDRLQVIATIPVPGGPLGVVVPATGGIAYVSTRSGALLALSLARHTLLGTVAQLPAGHLAGQMDYDAVTGEVYVPDPAGGEVLVIAPVGVDASGGLRLPHEPERVLAVPGGPSAVAVTFDGAYAFVTERDRGQVLMLDAASHRPLSTIAVGGAPIAVITGAYPPAVSQRFASVFAYAALAVLVVAMLYALFVVVRRNRRPARGAAKQAGDGES